MNQSDKEKNKSASKKEIIIVLAFGFIVLLLLLLLFALPRNKEVKEKVKPQPKSPSQEVHFDYNFFYTEVFQSSVFNHTFKLINDSTNEFIISEIRTGSTNTVIPKGFIGEKIRPYHSIVIPVVFYSDSLNGVHTTFITAVLKSGNKIYTSTVNMLMKIIEDFIFNPKAINFGELYPGQSVTQTVKFIPIAMNGIVLPKTNGNLSAFEFFVKNKKENGEDISELSIIFHSPRTTRSEYFNQNIKITTLSKGIPVAEIPVFAKTVPDVEVIPQTIVFPTSSLIGESRLTVKTRDPSKIFRLVSKTGDNAKEIQHFISDETNEFSTSHILLVTNKDIAGAQKLDIQLQILRNQQKIENGNISTEVKRYDNEISVPDALMILKGVESVREQIPPSRLAIRSCTQTKTITNDYYYWVSFDGERRHYKRSDGIPFYAMFNGLDVIISRTTKKRSYEVEMRNLNMQTSDCLFDPRITGISTGYGWEDTIQSCLLFNRATKIELIGKEKIDNEDVWHIRLTRERDYLVKEFWIDDKNNFRVYQFKECYGNGTNLRCRIAKSYYENKEFQWLPSRVEIEADDGIKLTIQILRAEADVRIPETKWTLASMEIPPNTSIIDQRIPKKIGHWDGNQIIPDNEPVMIVRKPLRRATISGPPPILLILILLSVVPLMIIVIYNFRKGNKDTKDSQDKK